MVIKSTMHYISGMYQECSESQILQMIGRAGRPQVTSIILLYFYKDNVGMIECNFRRN